MKENSTIKSLDPRITRADIPKDGQLSIDIKPLDQWQTYEVFHQEKKGDHHNHVGSLHAPNPEMAFLMAKEQYARRGRCVNIWVVKTSDIFTTNFEDEDMYTTNDDKMYREAGGYKVMDRINKYKKEHKKKEAVK
ncbi:MAG: 1,2-phenylacetyl-CoA epoxidase subunit B [Ignavibacteria bacterium]|nr:1,2-phenylacetyl-CoA epoxidase subunit B [Ignavibacteria bacterium]